MKARAEVEAAWTASVDDYATAMAIAPDGRSVAVGSASGEIAVLDARTGEVRARASGHPGGVLSIDFGIHCVASGGQDGAVHLWTPDGAKLRSLDGGAAWVDHVVFSPGGDRLATSAGRKLRLWTSTGEALLESDPHTSTLAAIAWSKSGRQVATACYGGAHLLDVSAPGVGVAAPQDRPGREDKGGSGHRHLPFGGSLISLAWSPNERVLASASQDCSVHFWRLPSGRDSEMTGYPFKPKAIAWDASSTLLATSGHKDITLWRFTGKGPEGRDPWTLAAHEALVTTLAWSPDKGVLASGSEDSGVIFWEPARTRTPIAWGFSDDALTGVAFCRETGLLVTTSASGRIAAFPPP